MTAKELLSHLFLTDVNENDEVYLVTGLGNPQPLGAVHITKNRHIYLQSEAVSDMIKSVERKL